MIYARVIKGEVVNRAKFEDSMPNDWPDRDQWQEATDDMQIGARLDGKRYVMPAKKEPEPIDKTNDLATRVSAIEAEVRELKTAAHLLR